MWLLKHWISKLLDYKIQYQAWRLYMMPFWCYKPKLMLHRFTSISVQNTLLHIWPVLFVWLPSIESLRYFRWRLDLERWRVLGRVVMRKWPELFCQTVQTTMRGNAEEVFASFLTLGSLVTYWNTVCCVCCGYIFLVSLLAVLCSIYSLYCKGKAGVGYECYGHYEALLL